MRGDFTKESNAYLIRFLGKDVMFFMVISLLYKISKLKFLVG